MHGGMNGYGSTGSGGLSSAQLWWRLYFLRCGGGNLSKPKNRGDK